ncbi:MAG: phosphomannomutase [Devosia sp.]
MANSLKFGTSGLRGLAEELAGAETRRYAAAFVRYLRQDSWSGTEILIGRDLRVSSPEIAVDVLAALAGMGVTALDAGEVPTPALALAAMQRGLPAIMVTGSHIPGDRNGLKFYRPDGEIDKTDEAGIVGALGDAPTGEGTAIGAADVLAGYRARYAGLLPSGSLSGWRIGVWQHSTVARELLGALLASAGAEIVPLGRSESFVAVDTEAVAPSDARQIADWVAAHKLDALVSADGDGDRPLLATGDGALVRGDVLGMLAAQFLGATTVVTPVTSVSTVETLFPHVIRTMVGSPFVIAGMRGAAAPVIGFEANGGLLLGSEVRVGDVALTALPTRDAILPLVAVLLAARQSHKSIAELVLTLPPRFAASGRLQHVPETKSDILFERLQRAPAAFFAAQGAVTAQSDIDGLQSRLASGEVIHYRRSGNAPELRCYTEAATAERAEALLQWGLSAAEALVR